MRLAALAALAVFFAASVLAAGAGVALAQSSGSMIFVPPAPPIVPAAPSAPAPAAPAAPPPPGLVETPLPPPSTGITGQTLPTVQTPTTPPDDGTVTTSAPPDDSTQTTTAAPATATIPNAAAPGSTVPVAAGQPAPPDTAPAAPGSWTQGTTAVLGVLNKVDGSTSQLSLPVGGTAQQSGDLSVSVQACVTRPAGQIPDAAVFVTIQPTQDSTAPLYRGWLVRSAPGAAVAGNAGQTFRVISCT